LEQVVVIKVHSGRSEVIKKPSNVKIIYFNHGVINNQIMKFLNEKMREKELEIWQFSNVHKKMYELAEEEACKGNEFQHKMLDELWKVARLEILFK
jgi:hypothetical protein